MSYEAYFGTIRKDVNILIICTLAKIHKKEASNDTSLILKYKQ